MKWTEYDESDPTTLPTQPLWTINWNENGSEDGSGYYIEPPGSLLEILRDDPCRVVWAYLPVVPAEAPLVETITCVVVIATTADDLGKEWTCYGEAANGVTAENIKEWVENVQHECGRGGAVTHWSKATIEVPVPKVDPIEDLGVVAAEAL